MATSNAPESKHPPPQRQAVVAVVLVVRVPEFPDDSCLDSKREGGVDAFNCEHGELERRTICPMTLRALAVLKQASRSKRPKHQSMVIVLVRISDPGSRQRDNNVSMERKEPGKGIIHGELLRGLFVDSCGWMEVSGCM